MIVLFAIVSFTTDYFHDLISPTKMDVINPIIMRNLYAGEVKSEAVLLKPTKDMLIEYELSGEISDWVRLEGPNILEGGKTEKIFLRIEPPKGLEAGTYSGIITIRYKEVVEVPVTLDVETLEPIEIIYGELDDPFGIDVKVNGTEFFGDLLAYENTTTCFKLALPEDSKDVFIELELEGDDDIDACIYSGDTYTPYMCSMRPRGRDESLKLINHYGTVVVCVYESTANNNSLNGSSASFSGIINFGGHKETEITNMTIEGLEGKILYVYSLHCKICRETGSELLELISENSIILKVWTDDDEDQASFDRNLSEYITGYYTTKDPDVIEFTIGELYVEGMPDYGGEYLRNYVPSSYICVCTEYSICDCFEPEGEMAERINQIKAQFNNLFEGAD